MCKLGKRSLLVAATLGLWVTLSSFEMRAQSSDGLEQMTLHVIPQSHIDIAWWWRYDPETIHVIVKRTLEMAFENFEKHPDYTFSFLQVPAIRPMERFYPELFYKFHYYLFHSRPLNFSIPNPYETTPDGPVEEEGRLKLVHGLWLESDGCLPSGESMVRQCLYGKRYYKHQFGIDVKTAWFADSWTHPWTYPQILKKSGIDSYLFQRSADGQNQERMFWWQAPDGSRVFAYKPASFSGLPTRERWESELLEVSRRYGVKDHIALMGVGDHGGGAPEGDIETIRKVMTEMSAKAKFSTPAKFLNAVLAQKTDFPIVNYEISGVDRGAYTTVGEIKKGNRQCENLLLTLEKFSSLATRLSEGEYRYPQDELNASWEKVMLNQTHDTISGTDILPATDDALRLYGEVLDEGRKQLGGALRAISSKINTEGQGTPVIVFNPLSWERNDLVQTDLEFPEPVQAVELLDSQGKPIPVQILKQDRRKGKHQVQILFVAEGVPSMGYKTYRVTPATASVSRANPLKVGESEIENEYFKIQIDPATACVRSIFDKRHGREILDRSGRGNLIQIVEDFGNSEGHLKTSAGKMDYRHKWPGQTWNVDSYSELKLVETGPARATIQVKRKFGLARFTQRVSLYPKIPRIDFDLIIDWEGQNRMVKVSFPMRITASEATYEIPYGTIRRPNNGEEHVAQKWVDISDQSYGVGLLNDSRYGYDVKDNIIRLSALRSPTAPVYSTDERGVHVLRYSLYPHQGGWQEADVMPRAYELNNSLIALVDDIHSGKLPPLNSFLNAEPKNIIVEVVKKAEDSDDLILRLYETEGKRCTAKVSWGPALDAVHQTNLLENSLSEVPIDGKSFQVPVGAYAIETFKLISDKEHR
ncbi:MAG: glycoside hydrolase family 38 C-terminal domain-containing protein [Acidobacteriota bacterium]